jgi:uncharacterized membrane protein required for colicin V production
MWLDILALLLLGIFAGLGARRGGLASGLSLLSLAVAYGAAIVCASRFGPVAGELMGFPAWAGIPVAGALGFIVAFLLMALLSSSLRQLERRRWDGSRSARDRFVGASFGLVRGTVVVLLVSYLALWMDALRTTGTVDGLPELGSSAAAAVTGSVVEAGMQAAVSDTGSGGRMVARVAARPGPALADLQAVLEHPGIAELRSDPLFWSHLEHGSVDAALNRGSFQRLARDASLRSQLAGLGLVAQEAAEDPRVFRSSVAEVFREVGPRLRGLRQDPALQELMQDPEVVAAVQSGDHLTLMTHPGFRAVVARAMEQEPR